MKGGVENYVAVAQRATFFVTDAALMIVPGENDETESDHNRASDWVESIGEKLEPVKEKVGQTLNGWFGNPDDVTRMQEYYWRGDFSYIA